MGKKTRHTATLVALAFILLMTTTVWLTISYVKLSLPLPQMAGSALVGVLVSYLVYVYLNSIYKRNGE